MVYGVAESLSASLAAAAVIFELMPPSDVKPKII
jgi:hypothetical protein